MIKVRFLPAAEIELLKEVAYYSKARSGTGIRFQLAVQATVSRAAAHPLGGAPSYWETRRRWYLPAVAILGLAGGADFFGKNPKELRAEFSKFNLRISPDLHEKLAIVARAEGNSINTLAQEALQQRVAA